MILPATPSPIAPDPSSPIEALRLQTHAALSGGLSPWQGLIDTAGRFAVNLAAALAILLVTLWGAQWLAGLVTRAVGRVHRRYSSDTTLPSFVGSLVRWTVIVVGMAAALQQLGVQTASILAVLGAASLAVGLALQGALSNVAAGVMLLVLRPYRIGDFVEINGRMGTVKGLDLFVTQLSDPDNLSVFMPNSKVFGEMIVNYSQPHYRRMELHFHIDYADNMDLALSLLLDCAKAEPRVLAKPAPWAKVTGLADSAVTVTLRAWAANDDYWDARYDMIKQVKETFEAAGLSFPYPHQVTVTKTDKAAPAPPATAERAVSSHSQGEQTPSQEHG